MASSATAQTSSETIVRFTGFLGDLRFSAAEVRADLLGSDPETRQIAIAMDENATAAFARFTRTHVNRPVSFYVCGQEMLPLTLLAPVDTGFAVTEPIELDRAAAMVAALNGQGECP